MNTIGERIREARKKAGLSQVELAEKINISKQLLYKYETGKISNIPSDKIESISLVCHADPWEIIGWQPRKTKTTLEEVDDALCGGSEIINLFNQLDDIDKSRILERIATMLEDSKYKGVK